MTYHAIGATLLSAAILSGCMGSQSQPTVSDQAYYVIDTRSGHICQQRSRECIRLSIVASQNGSLAPVESAYGQRIVGPNYPRSLMNMLLAPKDGSYTAKPLDESGKRYALPRNAKTDKAWATLNNLYNRIYDSY